MCLIQCKGKQQLLRLSFASALSYEHCALSKRHKTATAPFIGAVAVILLNFCLEEIETVIIYVSQFLFNFRSVTCLAL